MNAEMYQIISEQLDPLYEWFYDKVHDQPEAVRVIDGEFVNKRESVCQGYGMTYHEYEEFVHEHEF